MGSKKQKPLLKVLSFILLFVAYSVAFIQYDLLLYRICTGVLMVIAGSFLCGKLIWRYFPVYAAYMFDESTSDIFNKKIDRPRIFVHSIFLLIMFFMMLGFFRDFEQSHQWLIYLQYVATSTCFFISTYVLSLTWNEDFEKWMAPVMKRTFVRKAKEFKASFTDAELAAIFNRLIEYEFIEYDDLEIEKKKRLKFINIFYTGRIPETPEFILKMDHPQTHYFFEQLKIRSTIKLTSLCRIFSYEDGPIKSRALSASAARAKKNSGGPSNKKIIDAIFIFDR